MKQDSFELLAGAGYGAVKGIAKTIIPASKGAFDYMDDCIKNVSGTATVGQHAGEAIMKALIVLFFL